MKINTTENCPQASVQNYRPRILRFLESRSVAIKFRMFESEMPQVSDLGTGNCNLAAAKQIERLTKQKLRQFVLVSERLEPCQWCM